MRRVLQIVFIAGIIGFAGIVSFMSFAPTGWAKKITTTPASSHAPYPLPMLIGLGVSLCCIFGSALFLARANTERSVGSNTDSSAPASGNQDAIDQTLRQIDGLSASVGGQVPSEEALRRARAYVQDIGLLLPREGMAWWVPDVSTGQGGSIVFLWQQGGSYLSLSFHDTGMAAGTRSAEWVFDPGSSYADIVMLASTHTLQRGIAAPAEFVNAVWGQWSNNQALLTD